MNTSTKEGTGKVMLFGVVIGNTSADNNTVDPQPDHDLFNPPSNYKSNDLPKGPGKKNAWTEDEHILFLEGVKKFGKGKWIAIATNFVPSRTPAQIASHAQKHFDRQSDHMKKRRRFSIFDVSTPPPRCELCANLGEKMRQNTSEWLKCQKSNVATEIEDSKTVVVEDESGKSKFERERYEENGVGQRHAEPSYLTKLHDQVDRVADCLGSLHRPNFAKRPVTRSA